MNLRQILLMIISVALMGCQQEKKSTVGIIVPLEHQAMNEIVEGFSETLHGKYPRIKITVKNAQGDQTLQRTIIQQMRQQGVDILVPIGTSTSQMALAMNLNHPVISLAALAENLPTNAKKLSIVQDEVPMDKHLALIRAFMPKIKKIAIVYSAQEKSYHEVQEFEKISNNLKIALQKLMVHEMHELFTLSKVIDKDVEAIFILKDHLIASSVQVLMRQAKMLNIPIITSDEGSVKTGGCFALGVKERDIGVEGALIAKQFFTDGTMPKIQTMKKLNLFINKTHCKALNIDLQHLANTALEFHYRVIEID